MTPKLNGKPTIARPRLSVYATCALILSWAPSLGGESSLLGQVAPDFALRSLQSGNLRLSEYRSEVVVINFWSGGCGDCRQAMPALNALYRQHRESGLAMLSVNVTDDAHHAASMAKSLNIASPVLIDERRETNKSYRLDKLPMTVLVDRAGVVRYLFSGYSIGDEKAYAARVRQLLQE